MELWLAQSHGETRGSGSSLFSLHQSHTMTRYRVCAVSWLYTELLLLLLSSGYRMHSKVAGTSM